MSIPKLAFIGFGRHAQTSLYPSIKHLGYQLSAVVTQHSETAEKAAAEYQIPAFHTDYSEMLAKEKPEAVFVAAKYHQQFAIVKEVLKFGAHVFVEKPLGMSLSEAEEISDLAAQANKQVMVGFMKRFAPAYVKAKALLGDKNFGQPLAISEFFTCRNFSKDDLEYILFASSHYVDLLRFYYGEVAEVSGSSINQNGSIMQAFSLCFESGAVGSLQFGGTPAWERGAQELTMTGTNGYIKISGIDRVSALNRDEITSNLPGWQTVNAQEKTFETMLSTSGGGLQALYLNGFVGEIKHFVESVSANTPVINSAAENLKTMQLIEKMRLALVK
jgi:predicted dehydrogenase